MAVPGGSCTYNNLIFDAANAETNLTQGKACFTGTYNFYCVNTGGAYHYNDCRIRMRVVVTKPDGITALPLTLISNNLILHAKENFMVKVFIEGYAYFDLSGCIWSGIDYYNSSVNGGWPGVVDIYNSLHTDPNGSICTQFQPQWYTINSSTTATATPSPLCVGGTVNLTGSSTVGGGCSTSFYNWSGPSFSSTLQNPSIINVSSGNIGTYTLIVTDGKVCYGTASTSVSVVADPTAPGLNSASPANGSTVCVGATVSAAFSAGSGGTGCSDEYQYSTDGGGTWAGYTPGNNITASTTGTNIIQIQTRRPCSGNGCDGTGETWATKVQWTVVADPTISSQPSGFTECAGGNTAITVAATNGTGTYTYQWYSNASNNTTSGTAIPGATNTSYTPPASIGGIIYYYCIVSASGLGCGAVTSNTATVTVVAPNPSSPTPLANSDYIWSGRSSDDWNIPSNWLVYNGSGFSVATVLPYEINNVIIPGGAYNTTCVSTNAATLQTGSGVCKNITIESGASLTVLNSKILNVSGNWKNDGTFNEGTGTVIFEGTTLISGSSINTFHYLLITGNLTGPASTNINITGDWDNYGTFTHNSGTVTFMGTLEDQHMRAYANTGGTSFYNLIINTPMEFNINSDYKVDNDFTLINANHYYANNYNATFYGNWIKTGGNYERGTAEVTLAGTNKNFATNTQGNFHNLNITGSYTITASGFVVDDDLNNGGVLYISPTGVLTANNCAIHIDRLWYNTGVFNKGTSRVGFGGMEPVEIRSGGYSFFDVCFSDNSAGSMDINISEPMSISHDGDFWNGIVYFTNTGSLTFTEGATSDDGGSFSTPSFVNGPVTKIGTNPFTFAIGEVVGSNEYWAPISIAAPSANSTITAQYKFDVPHDDGGNIIENYNSWMMCDPSLLHHVSGLEYWKLTSDNAEPAVTLYWKDANRSQITNLADLCVAHYEDCDGPGPGTDTKWAYKGGNPNAVGTLGVGGSGYVTSTIPFNSYSPITFGTRTSSNPLPIDLLSFNANCENAKVNITWSTASETNNDFFTIQRSTDASRWEFVKNIPGGGNSNSTLYYSTTDNDPLNGTSYYRLKQTDYNGQSEVFSPVSVICGEDQDSQSISYYPNPFTSEVMVDLRNINYEKAIITVYDLLGKKVYEMIIPGNESENQEIKLDLHTLPLGVYSVSFSSDGYSNTSKIIKNY